MNTINWNETYTNISPKLLGICRRYIKDIATAEDIVQDSFIVAIQKENTLKDTKALHGWLSRIVINMAIHHLKETKKINFSNTYDYDFVDNSTLMNTNTLELDTKSMLLASDIDKNDILEAIDSLPEHHKSVFNMYVIDQFSHAEIAQTLTISVGTSKSNLSRARKAIQTYLFEKLKTKKVDDKKKRRFAFLLFLGLENRIFAQFYQSKFDGFEIAPKSPFSFLPENVNAPSMFVGLSKAVAVSKITIFSIVFIALIGSFVYFFNTNSKTKNTTKNQNKIVIVIENKQENNTNKPIVTNLDSLKTETTIATKTVSEKVVPNKISSTKKVENTIQNPIKKTEKASVEVPKDSLKTEKTKVVVVKKQIIKRDTIYVPK